MLLLRARSYLFAALLQKDLPPEIRTEITVFTMSATVALKSSFFFPVFEIMRKELKSYFESYLAWIIIAVFVFLNGIFGFFFSVEKANDSAMAVQLFFYFLSGSVMFFGVLVSMRLFAEEKSLGTLELLLISPINEIQIISGKFFAALLLLVIFLLANFMVPLVLIIFSEAYLGQLFAGYLGSLLLGMVSLAIGMFYSAITKVQLLAAVLAGGNVIILLLFGFFSPYVSHPLKAVMRELSLYVHFMDFEKGVITLRNLVYFFSLGAFYFYLTSLALKSRRWH